MFLNKQENFSSITDFFFSIDICPIFRPQQESMKGFVIKAADFVIELLIAVEWYVLRVEHSAILNDFLTKSGFRKLPSMRRDTGIRNRKAAFEDIRRACSPKGQSWSSV